MSAVVSSLPPMTPPGLHDGHSTFLGDFTHFRKQQEIPPLDYVSQNNCESMFGLFLDSLLTTSPYAGDNESKTTKLEAPIPEAEEKKIAPSSVPEQGDTAEVVAQPPAAPATKASKRRDLSRYRAPSGRLTTLMVRNVPCRFTQEEMMALLDSTGFAMKYDFMYLPSNSSSNLGYGFINFIEPEDAAACQKAFTGYKFPCTQSVKVCEVHVAHIQGLENNIKHFHRTSAKKINIRKPFIRPTAEEAAVVNPPQQKAYFARPQPEDAKVQHDVPEQDVAAEIDPVPIQAPSTVSSCEVVPIRMADIFADDLSDY